MNICTDLNNKICPWITFDSLDFLNKIVKPTHSVFEYGSGSSSIWWLTRLNAGNLCSVEHDKSWYDLFRLPTTKLIQKDSDLNEKYFDSLKEFYEIVDDDSLWTGRSHLPASSDKTIPYRSYACEILNYEQQFDIIVVDGMARVLTVWLAIQKLKPDGFIVFDNSNRLKRYLPAFKFLEDNNFKEIPFPGSGPLNKHKWKTSIYVKSSFLANCFASYNRQQS